MAAIGMVIGGAVVNALAFTGCNYLFSMLGRSNEAEKERKRHDLAIEERAESEQAWRTGNCTSASYVLII